MTGVTTIPSGSWRELFGRERLGTATVLAGGVGLYATNEFLTISLLPSTVADIGGQWKLEPSATLAAHAQRSIFPVNIIEFEKYHFTGS